MLFVSHDIGAVGHLCSRTIWFDKGGMVDDGPTARVVEEYLRATVQRGRELVLGDVVAEGPAALVGLEVETSTETAAVSRADPLRITARIETRQHVRDHDVAIWVNNGAGTRILDEPFSDIREHRGALDDPGLREVTITFPPVLPPGEHTVGVWLGTPEQDFFNQGCCLCRSCSGMTTVPRSPTARAWRRRRWRGRCPNGLPALSRPRGTRRSHRATPAAPAARSARSGAAPASRDPPLARRR